MSLDQLSDAPRLAPICCERPGRGGGVLRWAAPLPGLGLADSKNGYGATNSANGLAALEEAQTAACVIGPRRTCPGGWWSERGAVPGGAAHGIDFEALETAVRHRALGLAARLVEAGCKHVVGTCCKRPACNWSVAGITAMLALRGSVLSSRFDNLWLQHALPSLAPFAEWAVFRYGEGQCLWRPSARGVAAAANDASWLQAVDRLGLLRVQVGSTLGDQGPSADRRGSYQAKRRS